jgi:rsbT co-antagonist protein RsbR
MNVGATLSWRARKMKIQTTAPLKRAEHLYDLLRLTHDPMLAWRLDGPIEFWNAGAERLYGFASHEGVGHISHALLQTKFPIEFTELLSQLRNERYWSGELRHVCKDGGGRGRGHRRQPDAVAGG